MLPLVVAGSSVPLKDLIGNFHPHPFFEISCFYLEILFRIIFIERLCLRILRLNSVFFFFSDLRYLKKLFLNLHMVNFGVRSCTPLVPKLYTSFLVYDF